MHNPCPIAYQQHTMRLVVGGMTLEQPTLLTYLQYDSDFLAVRTLSPTGGPAAGGSEVAVSLLDDRLLLDLGGTLCRFSWPSSGTSTTGVSSSATTHSPTATHSATTVNASIDASKHRLRCVAPRPPDGFIPLGRWHADAIVEVSINGNDFSSSAQPAAFTYYLAEAAAVGALTPFRGPTSGGTAVSILGKGFLDLGGFLCRFGAANTGYNLVPATAVSETVARCVSPPLRRLACDAPVEGVRSASDDANSPSHVRVCVLLNGEECIGGADRMFTYMSP